MHKILQTRSLSLFQFSWIKLGSNGKNDWCGVKKISDFDMYLFIVKGLKGGFSYIAKRYSKANNKYMKIMILQNRQYTYHTLISMIFMVAE